MAFSIDEFKKNKALNSSQQDVLEAYKLILSEIWHEAGSIKGKTKEELAIYEEKSQQLAKNTLNDLISSGLDKKVALKELALKTKTVGRDMKIYRTLSHLDFNHHVLDKSTFSK